MTALSQPAAETGGGARPAPSASAAGVPQPGVRNVANALTVLRLVLVPLFVVLLLAGGTGWRIAAFAVFLVASVTDVLDGRIARRRGLITDFGKIADPIADKALTGAALVTLSAQGELPWWVTAVILARELGVTGLRFWVIRHGVIAASRGGKIKTLLQVLAICLYVLPGPPGHRAGGGDGAGGRGHRGDRRRLRDPGRAPAPPVIAPEGAGTPAAELIALLAARQQSIAVAESLTGGLLAGALTDVPGASAVFRGGVVAYATELKAVLLGVDRALLAAQGAVSAEVAGAMAAGVRDRLGATVGAATTGVAGPDPAEGKPAGTVYIAASAGQETRVRRLALSGSRAAIRAATVREALALVLVIVREET